MLVRIVGALATATVIAGCAGAHGAFNPAPVTAGNASVSNASLPESCRHVGIIRISPCQIKFTNSNPGPVKVTVSVQRHISGTVVVHSDCGGAAGVAKISRRSNLKWLVTAGSMNGTCLARFVYFHNGHKDGFADLRISNSTGSNG